MNTRPQNPEPPYPYRSEEVSIENASANVRLGGTLTLPPTLDRVPAALLIPGSGAQDRDESLCDHRPFLVLADHLTRSGIAVLRLDDRGVKASTGQKEACSHADLLSDVRVAIDFLARNTHIDSRAIGVIGHSEGAHLATAAPSEIATISWVVLLALGVGGGEQILHEQTERIGRESGATEEQIAHERRMNESVFAILRSAAHESVLRRDVVDVLTNFLRDWPGQDASLETLAAHAEVMAEVVLTKSFRSFLMCDSREYLRRLHRPALALWGELDMQVPPTPNLERLEGVRPFIPSRDFTVEVLPRLNHLFQTATTGALSEYAEIEETLAPGALARVSSWIRERTRHVS